MSFVYKSHNLIIDPFAGQLRVDEQVVRIAPNNMSVLCSLLQKPGEVVSRNELFEAVWRNQIVSDDVLTKAISDLRAALRPLSSHSQAIETLPKRGYRWTQEVEKLPITASVSENLPSSPNVSKAQTDSVLANAAKTVHGRKAYLISAKSMSLLLLGAALIVIIGVLGKQFLRIINKPKAIQIAVLPIEYKSPELKELSVKFDRHLRSAILQQPKISFLSPKAMQKYLQTPYPALANIYGTEWVVESSIRKIGGELVITCSVVDARTGLVNSVEEYPISLRAIDDEQFSLQIIETLMPLTE